MEQRSYQREVRTVDPAWSLGELMARIAKALVSDGPALALTEIAATEVSPKTALIVRTTGSSGAPKDIELSASALLSSARASNKFLSAKFGATWSLLLPLNHIAGINVLIRSLELGTTPTNLIGFSGKYPKVDFTAIVPTQLYRALHGDENLLQHLQSARAVLVGGAALTTQLRSDAVALDINVIETYGSTETSGGCVYDGVPLDGVEIKVADNGQIAIRGRVLAQNLVDNDGWYFTSDAGRIENGKLIVEGRIDEVVITGGENVSLTAIERVITQRLPNIQVAAFPVPHPEWGQAIHLAIAGSEGTDENAIQEVLVREIGIAAKIKGFHYLSELPLKGIGKIDRVTLGRLINE
jgi:O-succinylbenzoic acid--CoA ligase